MSFKFTDTLWIYIKGISFAWSTYLNTAIAFTSSRLEYVQNNTAQFVVQRSRSLILPYQNYQVTQGHGGLACLKTHDPISFNTYRREDDYCCRMPWNVTAQCNLVVPSDPLSFCRTTKCKNNGVKSLLFFICVAVPSKNIDRNIFKSFSNPIIWIMTDYRTE